MPSTLPPSVTTAATDDKKPRYVTSQSGGHAAHPDDIMASCRALQSYVSQLQSDSERELHDLDARIHARELAEKRRVAPGWLDSEARLLEPERAGGAPASPPDQMGGHVPGEEAGARGMGVGVGGRGQVSEMAAGNDDEGAQMDRAFGSLAFRAKEN